MVGSAGQGSRLMVNVTVAVGLYGEDSALIGTVEILKRSDVSCTCNCISLIIKLY